MSARDDNRPLAPEAFRDRLDVSRENMERLAIYADRLRHWNNRINLVGRSSIEDIWRRHMLDSAQLLEHMPPNCADISDLGAGAGFPGLVLAILSGAQTHLIESDARKSAFLMEIVRLTDAPAIVHTARIEEIAPFPVDVITARALAPLAKLLRISSPIREKSFKNNPICLFLKGARWREELTEAEKEWSMRVNSCVSISDPTGRVLVLENISRKDIAP
jgi:16S rRNA (guanine527-N7)-methyltransferase